MAAKKPGGDSPKQPNKIRFVLLEADLSDNNLTELTAAITQALRPTAHVRQLVPPKQQGQLGAGDEPQTPPPVDEETDVLDAEFEDTATTETEAKQPKSARPKKFKPPTYLHNLIADVDGFKAFAKEKAPDTKNKQYLAAAYWLKEFGDCPTVNADKIYTCYKTAEWSVGFNDWSQTFHNLVYNEFMRKTGKGEFAINPTGEAVVKKGNG